MTEETDPSERVLAALARRLNRAGHGERPRPLRAMQRREPDRV